MRKYFIKDAVLGVITVKCKYDDDCLFCKHCDNILYDYSVGVHTTLCDKDIEEPIHHGCKYFEERDDLIDEKTAEKIMECRENTLKSVKDTLEILSDSDKEKIQSFVKNQFMKSVKKATKDVEPSTFIDVMQNAVELKPKVEFNKLEMDYKERVENLPLDNITTLKMRKREENE